MTTDDQVDKKAELLPYPFFHYRDYSTEVDPDPLTPLTFAGRMPNFPAKVHAILSRSDLSDVISWLPHGRSFLVLKPREFESRVLPVYFKHSKITSFIRQANGWGFRRVMQGPDRNSYYHPRFLRGLPHLCKLMKRPAKSQKELLETGDEPDFYKISQMYPVPDKPDQETMLLQSTLQDGPQARMPIFTASKVAPIPDVLEHPVMESVQPEPHSALGVLASVSTENLAGALLQDTEEPTLLADSPPPANAAVPSPLEGLLPPTVSTGSFQEATPLLPVPAPGPSFVQLQLQPLVPTAAHLGATKALQDATAAADGRSHTTPPPPATNTSFVAIAPNPLNSFTPVAIASPSSSPDLTSLSVPTANVGVPQPQQVQKVQSNAASAALQSNSVAVHQAPQARAIVVPQAMAVPQANAVAAAPASTVAAAPANTVVVPEANAIAAPNSVVVPQQTFAPQPAHASVITVPSTAVQTVSVPQANAIAVPKGATIAMPQLTFVPPNMPGMDANAAAQFAAGFAMATAFGQQHMQTMMEQANQAGALTIQVGAQQATPTPTPLP